MAVRKRNPILGSIMAVAFIGFGAYRLYAHFGLGEEMASWRLVLSAGFIAYGLYIAYTLLPKKDV
ncbi:hypothetical protein LY01_01621 [Nonlabens xylanidelens]|uniref:Uncharacterized protein n=1 Tax=Nonlabens xylanidelens TaxID=191564 RepID=A0A2S6IKY9_9FLAO|nr:hypothetical protein [Nonlabens xylanidelens]PPK94868.1 hypothetical protein LY01_01621 [Nonlabens xylanidelens]PQJ17417.1 hypothetical protein BST94_10180 [Nonlabens xylanidelens]